MILGGNYTHISNSECRTECVNVLVRIGPGRLPELLATARSPPASLSCQCGATTTSEMFSQAARLTPRTWLRATIGIVRLPVVAVGRTAAAALARPYGDDLPCAASRRRLPCEEDVSVCDE